MFAILPLLSLNLSATEQIANNGFVSIKGYVKQWTAFGSLKPNCLIKLQVKWISIYRAWFVWRSGFYFGCLLVDHIVWIKIHANWIYSLSLSLSEHDSAMCLSLQHNPNIFDSYSVLSHCTFAQLSSIHWLCKTHCRINQFWE